VHAYGTNVVDEREDMFALGTPADRPQAMADKLASVGKKLEADG
jgi:hypothetical protein